MRRIPSWPLACLAIFFLAGCAKEIPAELQRGPSTPRISGTISYQESITLPSGSRIHISLLDAAAGADPRPLATSEQPASGLPPFAFDLPVDEAALAAAGRPRLFVQVIVAGRSWFSNATTPMAVDAAALNAPIVVQLRNDMRPL
ncbi:MAG: YbaY family lipoprotein [Chthoniobacterales bacterium]